MSRGCAHAFTSFAPGIGGGFCQEPAIDGSDYCTTHDAFYPVDGLNTRQERTVQAHTGPVVVDRLGYVIATPKNLGWLLRHYTECDRVTVSAQGEGCRMVARMSGLEPGSVAVYTLASADVLWRWLSRPSFRGVRLEWFGSDTTCGAVSMPGVVVVHRPRRAQRQPMAGGPLNQAEYAEWITARCACCGVIRADLEPGHTFVDKLEHTFECGYRDDPGMPARFCCGVQA